MTTDERRIVLARAINETDWRPKLDCQQREVLLSLEESGWVVLTKRRRHYEVEVTSEGLLRHYLWEGE